MRRPQGTEVLRRRWLAVGLDRLRGAVGIDGGHRASQDVPLLVRTQVLPPSPFVAAAASRRGIDQSSHPARVEDLRARLLEIDLDALSDAEGWWAVVLEQAEDGFL